MNSKDRHAYKRIPDSDESIGGYNPPSDKQAGYDENSSKVVYTDTLGTETNILAKNLPFLLHELRMKGSQGWHFSSIFQHRGKPMQNLEAFENSLQSSPTTALLDYWLLRLGGHIRSLDAPKTENEDAKYLTDLYHKLAEKLTLYETEMGKLANNPSRHQNQQRQNLVSDFQREWRELVQPAVQKYKQTDVKNILKNLAAACTGFGLLWLFCKNIYRLSQRKGLGLFQFGEAHSRKVEHLQKLYAEIARATEKDGTELQNFFTHDIEDARSSCGIFLQTLNELQALLESEKTDAVYTEGEQDALELTLAAFKAPFNIFTRKLATIDSNSPDAEVTLGDIQLAFMKNWQKVVVDQGLSTKIGTGSPFPQACQELFGKIIKITEEFGKEIEQAQAARERRPSSPSGSSNSSEY
ncbi:MAG: hypothetical protein KBB94_01225 [Legionellaceae bacterium]|nr:hypothetical protein [Legionellaceae bacterium]MBP9774675.1 hypothetical protein [Legionellaceae bacterium]